MDRLARIEAFVKVADEGSFSAAARSLRTSQSRISKAVAELERHLGTRLLHRTTRTLSLTEAGTSYYDRMKRLIGFLDEANDEAVGRQSTIQGRLRVNTSAMLAGTLVVPALVSFRQAFPAVEVDLVMDDKRIDPVEQATDFAVRIGSLSDSTLRVRRAGSAAMGVFVATDYLKGRNLVPEEVTSFAGHLVIQYANQKTAPALSAKSFSVSNGLLAREVCLNGGGLAVVPVFTVAGDVEAGRLVQVMPDLDLPPMEVSLLHPFPHDAPRSVTAFIEFAIARWRDGNILH